WLILEIPLEIFVSRRKVPLFCPRSLLISPNPDDHRLVIFFLNNGLESVLFQQTATFDAGNPAIGESLAAVQRRAILPNNQVDPPLLRETISKCDHLRDLITGVD